MLDYSHLLVKSGGSNDHRLFEDFCTFMHQKAIDLAGWETVDSFHHSLKKGSSKFSFDYDPVMLDIGLIAQSQSHKTVKMYDPDSVEKVHSFYMYEQDAGLGQPVYEISKKGIDKNVDFVLPYTLQVGKILNDQYVNFDVFNSALTAEFMAMRPRVCFYVDDQIYLNLVNIPWIFLEREKFRFVDIVLHQKDSMKVVQRTSRRNQIRHREVSIPVSSEALIELTDASLNGD